MNLEELMLQSEAIIFAADRPVNQAEIAQTIQENNEDLAAESLDKLNAALEAIVDKYSTDFYPFEVKRSGGGYQFLSKSSFHPLIAKLNGTKFRKRLSSAAMESMAIIAYRQPTTKSEIEYIRGVNSDYSVQKLLDLELIVILGRKEDSVGKPLLYGTSNTFMDYLGINSIDELPKLNEIHQYEDIIPTDSSEALPDEGESKMVVNENGEIDEIDVNEQPEESAEIAADDLPEEAENAQKENPPLDEEKDAEDEDMNALDN